MQCVVDLFEVGEKKTKERLDFLVRKQCLGLTTWSEDSEISDLRARLLSLRENKACAEKMVEALTENPV